MATAKSVEATSFAKGRFVVESCTPLKFGWVSFLVCEFMAVLVNTVDELRIDGVRAFMAQPGLTAPIEGGSFAWYCARTKPKHEHIVAAGLKRNLGLEVFH